MNISATSTLAEQVVEAFHRGQSVSIGALKAEELSALLDGIKRLIG